MQPLRKVLDDIKKGMAQGELKEGVISVGIYGTGGMGKTILAMRMAQLITPVEKEILYIDFSNSFSSITLNPEWNNLAERTTRFVFQGMESLAYILNLVHQGTPEQKLELGLPANTGTIVLDEFSQMLAQDLYSLANKREAESIRTTKGDVEQDKVEWADYGKAKNRAAYIMSLIAGMKVNTIFTYHQKEDAINGPDTPRVVRLDVSPAMVSVVTRSLHFLIKCSKGKNNKGETIYTLRTDGDGSVETKSKISSLLVKDYPHNRFLEDLRKVLENV